MAKITKPKTVSAIKPINEKKATVVTSPKNLIQNLRLLNAERELKGWSLLEELSLASLEENRLGPEAEVNFIDTEYYISNLYLASSVNVEEETDLTCYTHYKIIHV